jgi:Tol biopolymer transport system component
MEAASQPKPDEDRPSGFQDPEDRLDSWKAVASYLGRSDKTVRRWEEREGLPIHRLHHDKRGSVYAYKKELDSWWAMRKASIESEEPPAGTSESRSLLVRRSRVAALLWTVAGMTMGAALSTAWWFYSGPPRRNVQFSRITDAGGIEDSPAISPDEKMVAFVARASGRRQIWVRLLARGAPLQITRDDTDHDEPRWAPDSSSLIYFSPSPVSGRQGTIWEVPALGGPPRRIALALGCGDFSHDGRYIALFRSGTGRTELVAVARAGPDVRHIANVAAEELQEHPRWSPDDRWIAFRMASPYFDERIYVVAAAGGQPREVARADELKGLSWLGDGSGLVYSSSAGSTILYPPSFNLRTVRRDGTRDRQLTFGDVAYVDPDVHRSGRLVASRVQGRADIWRFPIEGKPEANSRNGVRITQQTSHLQTPSVSPDGQEMVYLSDNGGHGNLWIAKTDGTAPRQITFERDPMRPVGVPVWSPTDDQIVFILTRNGQPGQWVIRSDGSGLRQLVPSGIAAAWSSDGQWVYYVVVRNGVSCIEKISIDGGRPVLVRSDQAYAPVATDGSVFYYATFLRPENRSWDYEFRRASSESGKYEVLARIAGGRAPDSPFNLQMVLSPDRRWLAAPLNDGGTTNLWLLPAAGGDMRQVTDFGTRPVEIVRRVSWSPDSKYLYAAVAERDADIVMLDGLLP